MRVLLVEDNRPLADWLGKALAMRALWWTACMTGLTPTMCCAHPG